MKVLPLGLQTSTTTSYDQTKTTLQGRVGSRSVTDGNGAKTVLGANPIIAMDVFDDTGTAPTTISTSTPNGRLFVGLGVAAGVWTIAYYQMTTTAGVTTSTWIGNLKLTMTNAATYVIKGFKVDDSTPSAMVIQWATTHTTLIDGGYFGCWGVNITDFVKVSVATFPQATAGSTTKTVYQMGDAATQAATTLTVATSLGIDTTGKKAYVRNGLAATPSIFVFDYSVPPTGTPTAGYVNSNFTLKTGTLAAETGTVLLTNNADVMTPSHTSNSGSLCLTWLTSTQMYLAKVSDITSGVTTLPTLVAANVAIGNDYDVPATITHGGYDGTIDKWLMRTASGPFMLKQMVSTDANGKMFGGDNYIKTETGGTINPVEFAGGAPLSLTGGNGFFVMSNSTVGQRNLLAIDVQADETSINPSTSQIYTSIISPVVSANIAQGVMIAIYKEFSKRTVYPTIQYRVANFTTGPGAGFDATWTSAPKDGDLSLLVNATSAQFRFVFTLAGMNNTNSSQYNEAYLIYKDTTQNSENWVGSVDNTSTAGASPFRVSFRLQKAYATSVPKLFIRGVDDSLNAVVFDTVTNIANMEYTTNNGTSYTPMGTIPNTPLTTELRFSWTSPDGVRRRWSISES